MKKGSLILAAAILAVVVTFFVFSRFFVDLLWFSSLGFRAVFTTTWLTSLGVFVGAAGLSAAMLLLNGFIAVQATSGKLHRPPSFRVIGRGAQGMPEVIELSLDKLPWRLIVAGVAAIVGLFIGIAQMDNWDTLLKWYYAVPFGPRVLRVFTSRLRNVQRLGAANSFSERRQRRGHLSAAR